MTDEKPSEKSPEPATPTAANMTTSTDKNQNPSSNKTTDQGKMVQAKALAQEAAPSPEDGHYEEVSEYRIGEGPPPLFLVVAFIFIVVWAMFSWIPFFGY